MAIATLFPHQPAFTDILPKKSRQGRSKKKLRPVVKFDGRVFVAHFEGRAGLFFGHTEKEAVGNLKVGV
jgi:hypothetical protein